jgi:4-hydroxy-tetrahydrodipicolinate reductase
MSRPAVALVGATGRLGRAVGSELADLGVPIVLRAASSGWTQTGSPSVVFDASSPDCFDLTVDLCLRESAGLVYAVSALPNGHRARLADLAQQVPVVHAVNLSPGHWLQVSLLEAAAALVRRLPSRAVGTVSERHPLTKVDRPSASAGDLAQSWKRITGQQVADIASIRGGHPVSDHEARLDFDHESLVLRHLVTDIRAAAVGAVAVLQWTHGAAAGLYLSRDVFDELFQEGN